MPSTIPVVRDRAATLAVRARFATPESGLLGHFGTYGPLVASRLKPALESILSTHQNARVLLIGRNGERFHDDFVREHQALASRVFATGALAESDVSIHLGACDVMIQPYPDGITSRNTSALAGLAHGKATATTTGRFTEDFWRRSGAVFLAPDQDARSFGARHDWSDQRSGPRKSDGLRGGPVVSGGFRPRAYDRSAAGGLMRVAVANWHRRVVGGAESYIKGVVTALESAGVELAMLSEVESATDRERIELSAGRTDLVCQ